MKKIYKSFLFAFFSCLIGTASATDITGNMYYLNDSNLPISGVGVQLKNMSTNSTSTCITDQYGFYHFENVVQGNYKLSATSSSSAYQIGWESAWMVLSYLAGQTTLTDIQFLAADVNGNGKVKLNDFVLIVNHLLHGTPFPIGEWVFEEYYFTVDGTKDQPGGMSGSSAGDLTGVFVPGGRNLPAFPVEHNTQISASANDQFTVSLTTYDALNLTGAGIIFNYPSNLITIESVEFAKDDFQYAIEGNQLKIAWYSETDAPIALPEGSALATLHCRASSVFGPGTEVNISMDGASSLAGEYFTKITNAKLGIPTITYGTPTLCLSNYPNPFSGSTTLSYYLPEDGNATVKIYSYSGQLIMNVPLSGMSAGYHQLEVDASRWTPGNYVCQIQCEGSMKYTGSRILIKTN